MTTNIRFYGLREINVGMVWVENLDNDFKSKKYSTQLLLLRSEPKWQNLIATILMIHIDYAKMYCYKREDIIIINFSFIYIQIWFLQLLLCI